MQLEGSELIQPGSRFYPPRRKDTGGNVNVTPISKSPLGSTGSGPRSKIRINNLQEKKARHEPISALALGDFTSARLADEAGIDFVLVGDSLGSYLLGYENTLPVTLEEMLHHTRAVRRGVRYALVVADMPFGTYQVSLQEGVKNASRFLKEAGAEAVKIEGGEKRAELVRHLLDAEIPVMGHIGLTPQSVHRMSGYKVQGKTLPAVEDLMRDAIALERAGAFAIVLEGVPREVAAMITAEVSVPTIGIGAGPDCAGQILVFHDLIGLTDEPAKFVRQYANVAAVMSEAVHDFKRDLDARAFPSDAESYHLPKDAQEALGLVLDRKKAMAR
jgi:3-methyl-2-oxobutanoate hydroxymethyltransferase